MLAALLTALLFSLSAVTARRIAVSLGALKANTIRLALALGIHLVLMFVAGTWAGVAPAFGWLALSGLIGFGIGDVALYLAIVRIGSRLTTLLLFCVGPLVGAAMEFLWLDVRISAGEILAILAILAGLALVLRPSSTRTGPSLSVPGVLLGILAGLGQAVGAVFSRRANTLLPEGSDDVLSGLAQACVRVGSGLPIALLALLAVSLLGGWSRAGNHVRELVPRPRFLAGWVLVAALCGPVIGVGCFQWALFSLPSGIVLAVVALVPIFVMPWAYFLEGDRPTKLALAGTALAVAGVASLALV